MGAPRESLKCLARSRDGHDFENGMSKDALPAVGDDLNAGWGYDSVEGVEEAVLSGVDENGSWRAQLLIQDLVKYKAKAREVKGEMVIK